MCDRLHGALTILRRPFPRLHEREQPASGLLRVHAEFLVRRGAPLPGRLGTAASIAGSTRTASFEPWHRTAATAMRVPATTAAPAAQVAVPTRAAGRRRRYARTRVRRAGASRPPPDRRPLLPSAVPYAAETQQKRARGPRPSGPVPDPAATSPWHYRHRTDYHQRVRRRGLPDPVGASLGYWEPECSATFVLS